MIEKLIVFLSIAVPLALAAADDGKVTQYVADKDTMIVSAGIAMAEQSLAARGIKTLSLNGNEVIVYSPSCEVTICGADDLDSEVTKLFTDAKNRLSTQSIARSTFGLQGVGIGSMSIGRGSNSNSNFNINNGFRSGATRYISGGRMTINGIDYSGFSAFSNNGYSLSRFGQDGYSVASENLPNDMIRIFVHGDIVAVVYKDGRVQMKPENCLASNERLILVSLKQAAEAEEKSYKEERDREREERAVQRAEEKERKQREKDERAARKAEEKARRMEERMQRG